MGLLTIFWNIEIIGKRFANTCTIEYKLLRVVYNLIEDDINVLINILKWDLIIEYDMGLSDRLGIIISLCLFIR